MAHRTVLIPLKQPSSSEHERLQQTGTRSAHQRLQARRGVEAAWFEEYAHCVANGIVEDALEVRATRVVFEHLEDIRDRISNDPDYQQWMFDRIQRYVEYKLEPFGVAVTDVRPQDTSKQCSHTDCRHTTDTNRSGKQFVCERCGRSWNADYNAARNIGMRYLKEELPASQTRSTGKATRQLALMSGTLSPAGTFTPHDWVSTDKPTASAVGR